MIVYGTKSRQVAKEIVVEKCPACGKQNSTELYIFQKYAHLFWIPFFPIGKTAISQCDHCKKVLKSNEMSESIRSTYDVARQQIKTPLWAFSGGAIVAILIGAIIVLDKKNDEANIQLVGAPQGGDVFTIKTTDNQYTLALVERIKADSVYIRYCDYESNKISGLGKLKRKGKQVYSPVTFGYSKGELKEMLNSGEIIDIDRE
ncbi:MAG: zinc-ribbon domain-containing protein [Chitinophagaceae bacterium]|nr:MAG: zinc-ribbon domain-containing protein [Chitinophagaceae bacterium]